MTPGGDLSGAAQAQLVVSQSLEAASRVLVAERISDKIEFYA